MHLLSCLFIHSFISTYGVPALPELTVPGTTEGTVHVTEGLLWWHLPAGGGPDDSES